MGRTNLAGPTTHPACHPVTEKVFPQLAAAEGGGWVECVDDVEMQSGSLRGYECG
jgi:hypothetical protein